VLLLGALDLALLLVAAQAGWAARLWQLTGALDADAARLPNMLAFAGTLQAAMVAVGVYGVRAIRSVRFAVARLLVAVALGILGLSLVFFLAPPVSFWRSSLLYATWFALAAMILVRILLKDVLGGDKFKRRVMVLGAGPRAARIAALARQSGAGFQVVGCVDLGEGAALPARLLAMGAGEVVLAIEERRNALPLNDLLRIKTTGVQVHDFSTFLERETGRVDLDSLNPSWLIFSDGFSAGRRASSIAKRVFDVAASLALLALTLPLIAVTALAIVLESKGPAFFRQRRVGLYGIRKLRIDELPQAWSVLKGEMSFVGPRPERPQFVADLEARLPYYAERHVVKPGITGWAQINYPYGASVEDAREKLEFDLYYAKNYTPFLDLLILLQTARVVIWPEGAR
jgi:lipopolysaccharide/colanic/teichoic acid biosynthesis glycosyltransferase